MSDNQPFSKDPNLSGFEQSSHQNGDTFWLASEVMRLLGYSDASKFRAAIVKAQKVCLGLDIPVEDNFVRVTDSDGTPDTRLTRFACYLVAMNSDVNIAEVAKAQAYFAAIADSVRRYQEEAEGVARLHLRSEIKVREKSLSGVAEEAEVEMFGLFQNAGYRGMYNMNLSQLKAIRNIPTNRTPLDFMGKSELAANLFRITQTEERIKNGKIVGQKNLEGAAEFVGRKVRETMKATSGTVPENLPVADDIKIVRKEIKQKEKKLKKIDSAKKKR
ncbi:MAG TPA: BRO family protein [candidate division Zixibacteria bacterium]|nr:BRO family protein [candidate division Zixibacteria bacterium]